MSIKQIVRPALIFFFMVMVLVDWKWCLRCPTDGCYRIQSVGITPLTRRLVVVYVVKTAVSIGSISGFMVELFWGYFYTFFCRVVLIHFLCTGCWY